MAQPCDSTRGLIFRHTGDICLLLVCEIAVDLILIAAKHWIPELQPLANAVQTPLEFIAAATVGFLGIATLLKLVVRLWMELSAMVKEKEEPT